MDSDNVVTAFTFAFGIIIFSIASIAFVLALVFALIALFSYFTNVDNEEYKHKRKYIHHYLKYALVSFLISGVALLLSAALCSYGLH